MTEKTTVEITCDKCGNSIDPNSAFWRAYVSGHLSGGMAGGTELRPDWIPSEDLPDRLDFCLECVQPVFGDVIWNVAKAKREARGTTA